MRFFLKTILKNFLVIITLTTIIAFLIAYMRGFGATKQSIKHTQFTLIDGSTYVPPKNKPLLIHFWASWCKICTHMHETIEALSKEYDVVSVAVHSGDARKLQKYAKEHDLHFRIVSDQDGSIAKRFGIKVFPSDLVFNANGKLVSFDTGYTTTMGLWARLQAAKSPLR